MANNKEIPGPFPVALGVDVIDRLSRYDRSSFAADYAIGNQAWLSAASDNNKISRMTTQYQKERVDQEAAAGENSLSNWWLRSATTWHRGTGSNFYDADANDLYRFRESCNVDVWTQGQASLLKDTDVVSAGGAIAVENCSSGFWFIRSNALYLYSTSTSSATQVTAITTNVYALTVDGTSAVVAAADGVYAVSESALTATKLYTAPGAGWTPQVIAYVKSRLIVCAQVTDALPMRVFELSRNPVSPPVTVSLSTDSKYSYQSSSLVFNDVTEVSGAILVAVTSGTKSRVLSFTVDSSSTGNAALLTPIVVAEFPTGETVNRMRGYLSTYVILGTSKGLRVAEESSNGRGFTYGPITIPYAISHFTMNGEFVYATRSNQYLNTTGLWRLNLGTPISVSGGTSITVASTGYAYASDISIASTDAPVAVTVLGSTGRMVIATASNVYAESATRLAETGYIDSGFIRYGTTEAKQPVSFSVRSSGTAGTVGVRVQNSSFENVSFGAVPINQTLNIPLSANLYPNSEFEIRVSLSRDTTDTTLGATLLEWQLRALPAPTRSRTITLPLLCFSEERDVLGNVRVVNPWTRLRALEQLEQSGGSCLYQDFSTGEERLCVVRAVQFEQSSPPSFVNGFGGVLTVQLQTIDVEVTS